ncbi:hypothetical protein QOZ80_5AG0374900 [Eleusine coracana subsp. coracana]|nr:hypothetical protein QOZ80_5AG0374900 [Eleusine coracana subsp. coracana]
MKVSGAADTPCRPRSARYAVKGYPNYAEHDDCGAPPRRNGGGGGRAKALSEKRGRKRGIGTSFEASGKFLAPILQGEEMLALEEGRKRRVTDTATTETAASKIFPFTGEEDEGVAPTNVEGDELGEVGDGCKSWRLRVMETRRTFSANYLHFEQMQESGSVLHREKRIGHLPGIDVGDQFCSRAEMVALGINSHWMNGIDYMGEKYRDKRGCENFTFPLATCIVMSGVYEDDFDKADEIIYTGQGGNNCLGNRHQKTEQKMLGGNLALKNSKDNGNPVRVIRGHIAKSSYTGKVYTYDGLYKVVNYWPQQGAQGNLVFKYRLRRLEGQPPLTTSQVLFTRGDAPMPISELPGLVCEDISNEQENFPIPATNLVDKPPLPPSGFVYSKSLQIPKDIKIPVDSIGCNCTGDCSTSRNCLCAKLNGSDLPYVSTQKKRVGQNDSKHNSVGRLVEPKAVVFECGTNCSCHCSCVNRTSQQGLKYHLEVFKTESKGWGVRTWDTILPGALICEYTGVLRRTTEVEGVLENNYIFDIDCLQTIKGMDGREQRAGSELQLASLRSEQDSEGSVAPEYCIDAGSTGNVARFINHSCQPNLFIQCVLSSHRDIRLAKIMLFAADTIPPLQELSYDYGYRLDSVTGADGNVMKLACHCGAPDCRKRLY